MKWSELSVIQKILFVTGWICVGVWFLLVILDETGILNSAIAIRHGLFGVFCLSNSIQKSRNAKVLWCVLAGAYFLLCLLQVFC